MTEFFRSNPKNWNKETPIGALIATFKPRIMNNNGTFQHEKLSLVVFVKWSYLWDCDWCYLKNVKAAQSNGALNYWSSRYFRTLSRSKSLCNFISTHLGLHILGISKTFVNDGNNTHNIRITFALLASEENLILSAWCNFYV